MALERLCVPACALCVLVAACNVGGPTFDRDQVAETVFPGLRLRTGLREPDPRREPLSSDFELEFTGARTEVDGPDGRFEYQLFETTLLVSPQFFEPAPFRVRPVLGGRFLAVDALCQAPASIVERERFSTWVGGEFLWRPTDLPCELLLRAATAWPFYGEYRVDALASVDLTPNLQLTAGYRWWHYEFEGLANEDFDVMFRGPVVGLTLVF